jgi:hypothetical protein
VLEECLTLHVLNHPMGENSRAGTESATSAACIE